MNKSETPKKQTKSRQRVRDHGEVFTNEREVKAMCDLVKDETERIDSRFLEPACGDGNFLAEILTRKLEIVKRKYKKSSLDYTPLPYYGINVFAFLVHKVNVNSANISATFNSNLFNV